MVMRQYFQTSSPEISCKGLGYPQSRPPWLMLGKGSLEYFWGSSFACAGISAVVCLVAIGFSWVGLDTQVYKEGWFSPLLPFPIVEINSLRKVAVHPVLIYDHLQLLSVCGLVTAGNLPKGVGASAGKRESWIFLDFDLICCDVICQYWYSHGSQIFLNRVGNGGGAVTNSI